MAGARALLAHAEEYDDAKRERAAAVALRDEAEKILEDAKANPAKLEAARVKADTARIKAEAKEKEFSDKIDRLKAELSALAAEM